MTHGAITPPAQPPHRHHSVLPQQALQRWGTQEVGGVKGGHEGDAAPVQPFPAHAAHGSFGVLGEEAHEEGFAQRNDDASSLTAPAGLVGRVLGRLVAAPSGP
jgi:hypothetical protein